MRLNSLDSGMTGNSGLCLCNSGLYILTKNPVGVEQVRVAFRRLVPRVQVSGPGGFVGHEIEFSGFWNDRLPSGDARGGDARWGVSHWLAGSSDWAWLSVSDHGKLQDQCTVQIIEQLVAVVPCRDCAGSLGRVCLRSI